VLLVLAQKMRHFFRSTDLIFRFGGEEFVIVFEPTDADSISNKMAEFLQLIR
jgi:GGDEF domain-containing protein